MKKYLFIVLTGLVVIQFILIVVLFNRMNNHKHVQINYNDYAKRNHTHSYYVEEGHTHSADDIESDGTINYKLRDIESKIRFHNHWDLEKKIEEKADKDHYHEKEVDHLQNILNTKYRP
tara:strand:+ start:535 stop:891 length:357 start_codon:yes stop_codon:yes gene_type:complete